MYIMSTETKLNGYKFRSRLHARWAIFFNAIGAEWEYEPDCHELLDGTIYIPDFRLKNVRGRGCKDIYVEIIEELTSDHIRVIEMFDHPVIIFGKIPDCKRTKLKPEDAEWYWSFDFDNNGGDWDSDYLFYNLQFSEGDNYRTQPKAAKGGGLVLDYPDDPYSYVDNDLTAKAYNIARQARFSYNNLLFGETPRPEDVKVLVHSQF